MPFYWTRLRSSPPKRRRDEVADICRRNGARLCENQTFYENGGDSCWALVQVPDDEAKRQRLLEELDASQWIGIVDADEKEAGKRPPPSRRP